MRWTRRCEPLQDDAWDRRTPGSEWLLRDLTEHITDGNRFTISILRGETSEAALSSGRRAFAGDDDTRRSLVASTLELEDRFLAPGASLTEPAITSAGTCPVARCSACGSTT